MPVARSTPIPLLVILVCLVARPLAAQDATPDSAFRALQQRGEVAMGVDQYTSWHHFDPLPDGGRIALERDSLDAPGRAAIRAHLAHIAQAFARGDFALPGFVHAHDVPGTRVMTAKRAAIRYEFHPLPGGGEVRITTRDPEALAAVHAFLAFQRHDHRVGDPGPH
ncbi:MAG TPA: hypothetical protein VEU55_03525 [Gemmatimonadales bacterium]|nr:hypothetical protein [Gemmatimonadales bacterium]